MRRTSSLVGGSAGAGAAPSSVLAAAAACSAPRHASRYAAANFISDERDADADADAAGCDLRELGVRLRLVAGGFGMGAQGAGRGRAAAAVIYMEGKLAAVICEVERAWLAAGKLGGYGLLLPWAPRKRRLQRLLSVSVCCCSSYSLRLRPEERKGGSRACVAGAWGPLGENGKLAYYLEWATVSAWEGPRTNS